MRILWLPGSRGSWFGNHCSREQERALICHIMLPRASLLYSVEATRKEKQCHRDATGLRPWSLTCKILPHKPTSRGRKKRILPSFTSPMIIFLVSLMACPSFFSHSLSVKKKWLCAFEMQHPTWIEYYSLLHHTNFTWFAFWRLWGFCMREGIFVKCFLTKFKINTIEIFTMLKSLRDFSLGLPPSDLPPGYHGTSTIVYSNSLYNNTFQNAASCHVVSLQHSSALEQLTANAANGKSVF